MRFVASAASLHAAALAPRHAAPSALLDPAVALYELQLSADALVEQQLTSLTPLSAGALFAAGLCTSLSPCCLSMLPVTVAYFGGGGGGRSALPALAYTAGLASVLASLGVAAASVGSVYGEVGGGGDALRAAASLLAVVFGLSLLEVVPLRIGFGSLAVDPSALRVPPAAQAFVFGASSALVASPCASPVLATIIAFVASIGDPLLGGALLFAYTLGYTAPVLLTSLLASSSATLLEGRALEWVAPAGGASIVAVGTYNLLSVAFGPA